MSMEKQTAQHHRDDLTGEHKFGDAGQLIIAILFLVVWILDSFFLKYTTFLNNYFPLAAQVPLGFVAILGAFFLARAGMKIVFGKVRENPGVIREGVFKVVRHPIYLSEILFYLGLLFFRTSLAAAVVWIIALGGMYFGQKWGAETSEPYLQIASAVSLSVLHQGAQGLSGGQNIENAKVKKMRITTKKTFTTINAITKTL